MKITNIKSGKQYQLQPDQTIEMERTNLFFNEYAEVSTPIDLPNSPWNRSLLGFPDLITRKEKLSSEIEVTVSDQDFFAAGKHAVISAKEKDFITTSLYLNEGSFYASLDKTLLSAVFENEYVDGVNTIDEGINFCRSLIAGKNSQFAIFPVLIDSQYNSDSNSYTILNRFGKEVEGVWSDQVSGKYTGDFYNNVERSETENEKTYVIPKGCYITPFIKVNYVLKRIAEYFGYTLAESFFSKTYPFTDMVILNNTADTLLEGKIKLTDLLPSCTVADFIDVIRKKFCCDFFVDEIEKRIQIKLFNEVIQEKPQADFSKYLCGNYEVNYPSYKQITINSQNSLSDEQTVGDVDNIKDLMTNYGEIYNDEFVGHFYRIGYNPSYNTSSKYWWFQPIHETLASSSFPYNAGDELENKDVTVPDCQPIIKYYYPTESDKEKHLNGIDFIYIGNCRFFHSKMVEVNEETSTSTVTDDSDNEELNVMLAFFYNTPNFPRGTITSYGYSETEDGYSQGKKFDYSLCYWGANCIYEKFYQRMDEMYRNSLHEIKGDFLIPSALKETIKAEYPVLLDGQIMLINSMGYTIGKMEPMETTLFTTFLHTPVTTGPLFKDYSDVSQDKENSLIYYWEPNYESVEITEGEYNSVSVKQTVPSVMFAEDYPQKKYYQNGRYCQQTVYHQADGKFYRVNFWFECKSYPWIYPE